MGKAVQAHLEPVRGRQQLLCALGGAAWGLLLAALVGAAFALAKAWFAPALSIWLPAAIAGGPSPGRRARQSVIRRLDKPQRVGAP